MCLINLHLKINVIFSRWYFINESLCDKLINVSGVYLLRLGLPKDPEKVEFYNEKLLYIGMGYKDSIGRRLLINQENLEDASTGAKISRHYLSKNIKKYCSSTNSWQDNLYVSYVKMDKQPEIVYLKAKLIAEFREKNNGNSPIFNAD